MNKTLQSASLGGLYTRFDILDTVTGVVRTITQAPNALTEQGLIMFGNDDPRWHQFNRCLLSSSVLSTSDIGWGDIIPTNSDPTNPVCSKFVASEVNSSYHGDVTKDDDGTSLFFEATKSWTFRQGIVGTFDTVLSGHMESTTDVPNNSGPIIPRASLTTPCPLTGDVEYDNWILYPISVATLSALGTITLVATDVLTVTHQIRVNLPKYQPTISLDNLQIGGQVYSFNARPYLPAYDALLPTNVPITKMTYTDSAAMTGGLVPGIRQSVTDGSFNVGGTPFITGGGDYTDTEQDSYIINDVQILRTAMKHTVTFAPSEGRGKVGYLLINGCMSWYEVEIVPPIPKRDVDKLSLTFTFLWG